MIGTAFLLLSALADPLEPLDEWRLLAAMRVSLANPAASIEVVETTRFPAPCGAVEFPLAGLRRPPKADPGAAVLWKGSVRYDGRRRFPIWARVRIRVSSTKIVTERNLRAGTVIEAGEVRLVRSEGFPSKEALAASFEEVVGRVLRGPLAAGLPVPLRLLREAQAVERGEAVRVEASSGGAVVGLAGRAVTSGSPGDMVLVRNLKSGKSFRARVEQKGTVSVRGESGGTIWEPARQ